MPRRSDDTVVVSEIFGPTFQGEGPTLGRRAAFVRLGRCDLSCLWCDTPYTWDWEGRTGTAYDPGDLAVRTVDGVVDELLAMGTRLVVITGGEPLLQRSAVASIVAALVHRGLSVEVETNGRHAPLADAPGVRYNVSPKLSNSGDPAEMRLRPDRLRQLARADSIFKFVCGSVDDLAEVTDLVADVGIAASRVWISPLGTTPEQVAASTAAVADAVLAAGWQLSSRLHVLAWGNERGR